MKIQDIIKLIVNRPKKRDKLPEGQVSIDREHKFDKDVSNNLSLIDENNLAKQFQTKMMANGINLNETKVNTTFTELTQQQCIELTKKFFNTINPEFNQKVEKIFEGKGENSSTQKVFLTMDSKCHDSDKSSATSPLSKDEDMSLYIPITGTLLDCYSLIHEITHSFDAIEGDNGTRIVLGEIAPQCMERLFDEFLMSMSEEDLKQYGMDRNKLKEDINLRKIKTFEKRYKAIIDIVNNKGNHIINTRYMLAQLYQTQFMKLPSNERNTVIMNFIDCIKNNDFVGANNILGIDSTKINDYLNDTIKEYTDLVNPKEEEEEIINNNIYNINEFKKLIFSSKSTDDIYKVVMQHIEKDDNYNGFLEHPENHKGNRTGFIKKNEYIPINEDLLCLVINDNNIYKTLIENVRSNSEKYENFSEAILHGVLETEKSYFTKDIESDNYILYMKYYESEKMKGTKNPYITARDYFIREHAIYGEDELEDYAFYNISNSKRLGKGAMCSEKNSMVNNLLSFCGYKTILINGHLQTETRSDDHCYTLFEEKGRYSIFDYAQQNVQRGVFSSAEQLKKGINIETKKKNGKKLIYTSEPVKLPKKNPLTR